MCGIAGIVGRPPLMPVGELGTVQEMLAAMAHRGPDDSGAIECSCPGGADGGCAQLGHVRLAVLDKSPCGHQPMYDPETGNWIVYNGEIYNYRDLARTPELRGKRLASTTDTEIVLKAYGQWGRQCVRRLRGMFAFGLWDAEKGELWCVRDRLGIKPFYYRAGSGLFVFASEVRALLASGMVRREISRAGLWSFLNFGAVQHPATIVQEVRSLLPGHWLRVNSEGRIVEEQCYWSLMEAFTTPPEVPLGKYLRSKPNGRYPEPLLRRLRSLLEEAVSIRLISDVPLGAFLSGGMDSSVVVALMARASAVPVRTFSVVFRERDKQSWNEARYSEKVARRFGTQHTEIDVGEDEILEWIPDAVAAIDQPTVDAINTWVVSKVTKDAGVTVALSGLGGDELFAGYPSFRRVNAPAFRLLSLLRRFPQPARAAINGCILGGARNGIAAQKIAELAEGHGSIAEFCATSRALFTRRALRRLFSGSARSESQMAHELDGVDSRFSVLGAVNAVSYHELANYMANMLLRDTDAMSMASSLEVRVPFIDHRVVEFTASLPGSLKYNGAQIAKPLLFAAVGDGLPASVARRPKMGFVLPFERWLRCSLREFANERLEQDEVFRAIGVCPAEVRRLWGAFLHGSAEVTWSRVWGLCVLSDWCSRNLRY